MPEFRIRRQGDTVPCDDGHLPPFAHHANCRGPQRPIFLADCAKKTQEGWENTKAVQTASKKRMR
jgi:hypothetical protein